MKMDKLFAGLVAFVAGIALSAGSASAGYMVGDPAGMKLVPYFETGDMRATIIGIQNLSPEEDSTLATRTRQTTAQTDLEEAREDLEEAEAADPVVDADVNLALGDISRAEKELADAIEARYTEHVFVDVNVYDAMGEMMGSATLCLASQQFGYVALQGPSAVEWQETGHRGAVLSVMDGDIPEEGYAVVSADNKKYTSCADDGDPRTTLTRVDDDTDDSNDYGATTGEVAAWTIIQDVGEGFFGTEVPTPTITMIDDDTNCLNDPDDANSGFNTAACGLIPEDDTVTARYDREDESTIYVWLAAGGDTDDTRPSGERKLQVQVRCEDGTLKRDKDQDGDAMDIAVAAPGMVTTIDPTGDELDAFTSECSGDRGVLQFAIPDGNTAGMVWTHISQRDGQYRMNFPGYSTTP